MRKTFILIAFAVVAFAGCKDNDGPPEDHTAATNEPAATPLIGFATTNIFPHDTTAFTEGLVMHGGKLYESTGATEELPQTRSLFGEVDLKTGRIITKAELDRSVYFGEGIAFLDGHVYQLTYKTKVGFVYDARTFKRKGQFTFPSAEGWGMTTDGSSLIMSDGTSTLTWLDPQTFKTVRTLNVMNENGPVSYLNELEYINGFIYANVYTTNAIVKIDPNTGRVAGRLDLSQLAMEARRRFPGALEMNGIAYDSSSKKILVTGKMWPDIYEISFSH